MGHDHSHSHVGRSLGLALTITLVFFTIELIGGFLSNSLALLADASHMLTDATSLVAAIVIQWIARRPSTPRMSFGYQRAEILGALFSGLLIWLLAGAILLESIKRVSNPQPVDFSILLIVATIGLIANIVSLKVLHRDQASNLNVRAAYLHIVSDLLGSVGAIASGLLIRFTGNSVFDPMISIFLAGLMLFTSWRLIREAIAILMQSAPSHIDPEAVKLSLSKIPQVEEVHDLHIWTVRSGNHALSVHLVSNNPSQALNDANSLLESEYGIHHTTIQVELRDQFQSDHCYDCAPENPVVIK